MFAVKALLDSGCTGSAINKKFVEKHGISTKKVVRPILIYNADGMRNKAGSIREYVEIRMVIQDHVKRIQLAVMNTGNMELFIGLEWLQRHNPSIDWKKSQILFNRCPVECGFISSLDDLEREQVRDVPQQAFHLSDGERVFAYNVDS
jgi:hypothetical protein